MILDIICKGVDRTIICVIKANRVTRATSDRFDKLFFHVVGKVHVISISEIYPDFAAHCVCIMDKTDFDFFGSFFWYELILLCERQCVFDYIIYLDHKLIITLQIKNIHAVLSKKDCFCQIMIVVFIGARATNIILIERQRRASSLSVIVFKF